MSTTSMPELAEANGHPTTDVFPVNSFREAAPHLRRPFTREAVRFKVQAVFPKANPTGGMIVAYIDARLVVDRLNLVVPHLWHDEYEPAGKQMLCHLTVDGITRTDVGDGNGKGLYSDALKRAAVKFGIGVPLYAVPTIILKKGEGLKEARDSLAMTDAGEKRVRDLYATWLEDHGIAAFGEPLGKGDVVGSTGDWEAEAANAVEESDAPRVDKFLTQAQRTKVVKAFSDAGVDDMTMFLTSVGAESTDDLTAGQAFALREALDKHVAKGGK